MSPAPPPLALPGPCTDVDVPALHNLPSTADYPQSSTADSKTQIPSSDSFPTRLATDNSEKRPSRARGLAHLINPTDQVPGAHSSTLQAGLTPVKQDRSAPVHSTEVHSGNSSLVSSLPHPPIPSLSLSVPLYSTPTPSPPAAETHVPVSKEEQMKEDTTEQPPTLARISHLIPVSKPNELPSLPVSVRPGQKSPTQDNPIVVDDDVKKPSENKPVLENAHDSTMELNPNFPRTNLPSSSDALTNVSLPTHSPSRGPAAVASPSHHSVSKCPPSPLEPSSQLQSSPPFPLVCLPRDTPSRQPPSKSSGETTLPNNSRHDISAEESASLNRSLQCASPAIVPVTKPHVRKDSTEKGSPTRDSPIENTSGQDSTSNRTHSDGPEEMKDMDEITRCPCGSTTNSGTMIACDECNTWQHSRCMGFRRNVSVPDDYFCHICRPDEIRPTCVAHPKYKEKLLKEREGKEVRRDLEALLSGVKPVELRKLIASDMRNKKTLLRSKSDVFQRYAFLLKTQFSKFRQPMIDGLVILLDMQRQDVMDKLDANVKRLRSDRAFDESLDKKHSGGALSQEGLASDTNGSRSQIHSRTQVQKRARPSSLSMDNIDVTSSSRNEHGLQQGHSQEVDTIVETPNGRGLSREERKLQHALKQFAKMEEREREKKKPRSTEGGASPKPNIPSRPKPSRSAGVARTSSPKVSSGSGHLEVNDGLNKVPSSDNRYFSPHGTEQRRKVQNESQQSKQHQKDQCSLLGSNSDMHSSHPRAKSTSSSRSDGEHNREAGKKERGDRARFERGVPKRKESASPDIVTVSGNGRRRSLPATERAPESKRRRVTDKKAMISKDSPKRDPVLDFALFVPGPSVLGSRMISKVRLSQIERESRAREGESNRTRLAKSLLHSRKEWLLKVPRQDAKKMILNSGKHMSPMKKRYRSCYERFLLEVPTSDGKHIGDEAKKVVSADQNVTSNTVSVSMVVVSEKGSLPDKGQILESSRLVLPGVKSRKDLSFVSGEADKRVCLKKRAAMFVHHVSSPDSCLNKTQNVDTSVPKGPASLPELPQRAPTPASPTTLLNSNSNFHGVGPPALRSSPVRSLKSPALRSVPPMKASVSKGSSLSPSVVVSSPVATVLSPSKLSLQESMENDTTPETSFEMAKAVGEPTVLIDVKNDPQQHDQGINTSLPIRSNVVLCRGSPRSQAKSAGSVSPVEIVPTRSVSPDSKPHAIPCLRSVRSMPVSEIRNNEVPSVGLQASVKIGSKALDLHQRSPNGKASGGSTISEIFQNRLQGFLKPNGKPTSKVTSRPVINMNGKGAVKQTSYISSFPSVKGSTAKLGAALPLSSKPNLDSLRNSNGLSPRLGVIGNGYVRSNGPGFRSKPVENDRPRASMPSFSSVKRSHASFNHGTGPPRNVTSPLASGKIGTFSSSEKGRFGHGRENGPTVRDEEKAKSLSASPQTWNRGFVHRSGWAGGNGSNHGSSAEGSGRGSRKNHHGS